MDEPHYRPFPSEQDVPWSAGPTVQNIELQGLLRFFHAGEARWPRHRPWSQWEAIQAFDHHQSRFTQL